MRMKTQGVWRQDLFTSILMQFSRRLRRNLEQGIAADPAFEWCTYQADSFTGSARYVGNDNEVFLLKKTGEPHKCGSSNDIQAGP